MTPRFDKKRKKPFSAIDEDLEWMPDNCTSCDRCHAVLQYGVGKVKWVEYVTGIEHDIRRCMNVREMAKTKKRGTESKVPRPEVIDDLKNTFGLKYGMNPLQKLYKMLQFRKDPSLAVSIRELAMALFPSEIMTDKHGFKWPTEWALDRARRLMTILRKWDRNYAVVAYATRTEDSAVPRYWNQQNREEIAQAEERIHKEVNGRLKNLDKAIEVVELLPEEREENEKILDLEIEQDINDRMSGNGKKKRKKKGNGDK